MQALENHSRRNDVRLGGLRETFGTNRTLSDRVQKILSEGLGVEMDEEFEIERVQRQLTPMLNTPSIPASKTSSDSFSEAVGEG